MNRPVNDAQQQYLERAQPVLVGGSLGNIYDDIVLCEGHESHITCDAVREAVRTALPRAHITVQPEAVGFQCGRPAIEENPHDHPHTHAH